jgi:hypothetical protein
MRAGKFVKQPEGEVKKGFDISQVEKSIFSSKQTERKIFSVIALPFSVCVLSH